VAKEYFVTMHLGVILLIIGFTMLAISAHSMEFDGVSDYLNATHSFWEVVPFVILLFGFGIKSGIFPVYTWLPKAHAAAPSNVSSVMSGLMVKMGIFGIVSIVLLGIPLNIFEILVVVVISMITMILGVFLALNYSDIKKILACSTVENMGVLLLFVALFMLGKYLGSSGIELLSLAGLLLHSINHMVIKFSLFGGIGVLYKKFHSKNIEEFGGVFQKNPLLGWVWLVSSASMAGVPLFAMFISEFILFYILILLVMTHILWVLILASILMVFLAFIGTVIFIVMTKLFSTVMLGKSKKMDLCVGRVRGFNIYCCILIIIQLFIGIFPTVVLHALFFTVSKVLISTPMHINTIENSKMNELISIFHSMALYFISLLVVFLVFIMIKRVGFRSRVAPTWGCANLNLSQKQQYSGESLTSSITQLIKIGVKTKTVYTTSKSIFPRKGKLEIIKEDNIEYGLRRFYKAIDWISRNILWFESRNSQQNILYLLIIVIILFVVVFTGGDV